MRELASWADLPRLPSAWNRSLPSKSLRSISGWAHDLSESEIGQVEGHPACAWVMRRAGYATMAQGGDDYSAWVPRDVLAEVPKDNTTVGLGPEDEQSEGDPRLKQGYRRIRAGARRAAMQTAVATILVVVAALVLVERLCRKPGTGRLCERPGSRASRLELWIDSLWLKVRPPPAPYDPWCGIQQRRTRQD